MDVRNLRNYFDCGFVCGIEIMYHPDDSDDDDFYKPSTIYTCSRGGSISMLIKAYTSLKNEFASIDVDNITVIVKVLTTIDPYGGFFKDYPTNYPITMLDFELWLKTYNIV